VTAGYLARRLTAVLVVLLIVSMAVFAITMILPGNAAVMILGEYATPDQLAAVEERLGLNRPLWAQYLGWITGVARGDWGMSLRLSLPVAGLIGAALGNSALLAAAALVSVTILAIPLGVAASLRRGGLVDLGIGLVAYLGVAMPEFVTATLLIVFLAGPDHGLFPAGGFVAPGESFSGFLSHLALPTTTLGLILAAHIARQTRSEMVDVLATDYVRAARLKGLSAWRVVRRHALPNALAPTVAVISLDVGYLLGGIIVVEEIFAWPGLGRLLIYALENRDLPVIQAITLVLAGVYALSNLVADLVIAAIDPRVRYA
jgi:peptide/nickel transport system permease protein